MLQGRAIFGLQPLGVFKINNLPQMQADSRLSMDDAKLPMHPAFLRLSERNRKRVMTMAELWEAPADSQLFHPGDSGEEVILVLQGRLESRDSRGVRRNWLQGDLWGEDRLRMPQPLEYTLRAVEYTRWLRWTRAVLLELCSNSAIRRALKSRYDSRGRLRTGFSESLQPGLAPKKNRRTIRPSVKPTVLGLALAVFAAFLLYVASRGVAAVSPLIVLFPLAVFLLWLSVFAVKNLNDAYRIEADSVISRRFDWKSLAFETRHIPTDQIQGVSIDQKGVVRQLLEIGTVRVKTAALEGELILKDVNAPNVLAQEIQKLRERTTARMSGREREEIRRNLEDSGFGERRPRLLRPNQSKRPLVKPTTLKVRKSPIILIGHTLLPVILGISLILGGLHFAFVSPLLIWIVYRFAVWRSDFFLASRGYITKVYRKPFGGKVLRHQIGINSLQNIRTEQRGMLSLILRYGNVILVTTGGAADITLKNVSNPRKIQEMFFRYRDDERQCREREQNTMQVKSLTQLAHALRQIQVN